jgi:hypothetical protein
MYLTHYAEDSTFPQAHTGDLGPSQDRSSFLSLYCKTIQAYYQHSDLSSGIPSVFSTAAPLLQPQCPFPYQPSVLIHCSSNYQCSHFSVTKPGCSSQSSCHSVQFANSPSYSPNGDSVSAPVASAADTRPQPSHPDSATQDQDVVAGPR